MRSKLVLMAKLFIVLTIASGIGSVIAYFIIPEMLIYIIAIISTIAVFSMVGIVYTDKMYNRRLRESYPLIKELVTRYNNGEISYLQAVEESGMLLGEFNKIVVDYGIEVQVNLGFMENMMD